MVHVCCTQKSEYIIHIRHVNVRWIWLRSDHILISNILNNHINSCCCGSDLPWGVYSISFCLQEDLAVAPEENNQSSILREKLSRQTHKNISAATWFKAKTFNIFSSNLQQKDFQTKQLCIPLVTCQTGSETGSEKGNGNLKFKITLYICYLEICLL